MSFFERDGIRFHYREAGKGMPFILQHGLGGDTNQIFSLYVPPEGVRMITMDCRGHGETSPVGAPESYSFIAFASDLLALMLHLDLQSVVIGGISMGAAVALRLATQHPQYIRGLVLSRPAWLDKPNPINLRIYALIYDLIKAHGSTRGLEMFKLTRDYADIESVSPDAATSLVGQFTHPRAEETLVKLKRIPADSPISSLDELSSITVPTLVLANHLDPIHPYEYGPTLAASINSAIFRELTPKAVSAKHYSDDFSRYLDEYLRELIQ